MHKNNKELKFKTNYEAWAQALFRFIYFKSKDKQLAQDIVQDSFVKYWDKMESIEEGKEKSYLYTTAKNLLYNIIAHQNVVQKHEANQLQKTENIDPHFKLEESEFKLKLESAIENLPDKQREVFLMHRIDGYKYKEIAKLLELSQKAVEKRMALALKQLRTTISNI
ncbi:MAG: RNA polymerase sigma-70 factor [Saprospiraceae bacterium]|nr:RNA polymerase sigma-70 factor [Saprospiraceae bacterium]